MQNPKPEPHNPSADPVYLASAAVSSLIHRLPAGTAYFIGVVLIVMMTSRLVQSKGSMARAAFPFVFHLRWGWHRVHRALERGKLSIDDLFDKAFDWCLTNLDAEPVRLGPQGREVVAVDSSTIARWRAVKRLGLEGKGYYQRAARAVRANIVALASSVFIIGGKRVGLIRRVRFAPTCEQAVEKIFQDLPKTNNFRLIVVDAGIATKEQFAQATDQDALIGRMRINCKLRCARPARTHRRGRPAEHGAVLHPGSAVPEVDPSEEIKIAGKNGEIVLRRWRNLHYEQYPETILDVVRIDDPAYDTPLIVGTTARELSSEEFRIGYGHRSVVETNFYVGQDSAATEMPRAWTEKAVERRIGLGLMAAVLLKAIAARCEPLAIGPWDRKPERTGGRLANHLDLNAMNFSALALKGVEPRKYRKNQSATNTKDL